VRCVACDVLTSNQVKSHDLSVRTELPSGSASESDSETEDDEERLFRNAANPSGKAGHYKITVYVEKGLSLAAMDRGGTSDPYVECTLVYDGKQALTEWLIRLAPEREEKLRNTLKSEPDEAWDDWEIKLEAEWSNEAWDDWKKKLEAEWSTCVEYAEAVPEPKLEPESEPEPVQAAAETIKEAIFDRAEQLHKKKSFVERTRVIKKNNVNPL
jgi:hypothetical protein